MTTQSVCLHAQFSPPTVKADQTIYLDFCPCPSIQALKENQFIDRLTHLCPSSATVGGDWPVQLAATGPSWHVKYQTSYKQLASG